MRSSSRGRNFIEERKIHRCYCRPQSYHQINDIIKKLENKLNRINFTEFEVVENLII